VVHTPDGRAMNHTDDDPTPPQGLTMPQSAPAAPAVSVPVQNRTLDAPREDGRGMFAGFTVTLVVHLAVALTSLRLGHREGNVSVARPDAPQQIIETHLMKKGGGDFDPRRVVHRQTPTLAEREAPRQVAISRDPTQVQLRPDAGAQDYMNAIITGRHREARGNQDLAELERIAQMAAAERANDPTAPAGEGDPTGSSVGDTTDPAQATHGAATKIDEFLRQHIRVTTALTGSEPRRLTFRIRLDASGAIESASITTASGNDALDADILSQAQSLAERHERIESLTPEETTAVSGRNINVNVPLASMH
jgi:hypothetical protein